MLKSILLLTFSSFLAVTAQTAGSALRPTYDLEKHSSSPTYDRAVRFGKGIFTGEVFRGSFSPDGKTFYFFKKIKPGTEDYRIFRSRNVSGKWTAPEKLILGAGYSDLYPSISRDGSRMVFTSYRPVPGDTSDKPNAHIWYVDKTERGWGKPVFMAKANRIGHYHSWVEFGWNGDIFFRRTTPDWRSTNTLITRWNGGEYSKPEKFEQVEELKRLNPKLRIVGGSPGPTKDLIFLDVATTNPRTGRGASDIWISQRLNGSWRRPSPLAAINTDGFDVFPFFSPAGDYLYFVRDFNSFYRIPMATVLPCK